MITVGICEDVDRERQYLRRLVEDALDARKIVYQVFDYSNGEDLLNNRELPLFDLFFLDIEMPGMDGIELGGKIREINKKAKIIYVTGHEGYLATALDVAHCFFYLSKPVTPQLIDEKLTTVFEYVKQKQLKIEIIVNKKKLYFFPEDIYCFEHIKRKTSVFTKNDGVLETVIPLNELAAKLSKAGFAEPHRGYLVNFGNIKYIEGDKILLINDKEIEISRGKIEAFKTKYNAYLQGFLF